MLKSVAPSIIHASFIILAAGGVMSIYFSGKKAQANAQLARSRAEMVQFNERRAQMRSQQRI